MNGFEYTEQKRKLLIGGTIIICLAMLMVTARRNVVSYDGYWHLKTGLDWLDHGLSLWLDHYSFTFNGEEISSPFSPALVPALVRVTVSQPLTASSKRSMLLLTMVPHVPSLSPVAGFSMPRLVVYVLAMLLPVN